MLKNNKSRFIEMKRAHNYENKLGEYITSYRADKMGDGNYPILSITKEDGVVLQSDKFKKRIASNDASGYKLVPKGIIVQGIHIDERNFGVQDIVEIGAVSPAYKLWKCDESLVNPYVLSYALRSEEVAKYIESKYRGSVRRRESISIDDFLKTPINPKFCVCK